VSGAPTRPFSHIIAGRLFLLLTTCAAQFAISPSQFAALNDTLMAMGAIYCVRVAKPPPITGCFDANSSCPLKNITIHATCPFLDTKTNATVLACDSNGDVVYMYVRRVVVMCTVTRFTPNTVQRYFYQYTFPGFLSTVVREKNAALVLADH
jgi:hypothetical protein